MRKWNKLLALVLAMVMVFGLTATAFAEEDKDEGEPTPISDSTPANGATPPAAGSDTQLTLPAKGRG